MSTIRLRRPTRGCCSRGPTRRRLTLFPYFSRVPLPRYHFAAPTRDTAGNVEAMALYAGDGTGLVRALEPAAAIVADLAAGPAVQ